MEQDVLAEVIEAEKAIQQCIEREQAASREWLEQVRKDVEEWSLKEERAIGEGGQDSLEQARKDVAITASDLENQAAAMENRLAALSDDDLSRIAVKRINSILVE